MGGAGPQTHGDEDRRVSEGAGRGRRPTETKIGRRQRGRGGALAAMLGPRLPVPTASSVTSPGAARGKTWCVQRPEVLGAPGSRAARGLRGAWAGPALRPTRVLQARALSLQEAEGMGHWGGDCAPGFQECYSGRSGGRAVSERQLLVCQVSAARPQIFPKCTPSVLSKQATKPSLVAPGAWFRQSGGHPGCARVWDPSGLGVLPVGLQSCDGLGDFPDGVVGVGRADFVGGCLWIRE